MNAEQQEFERQKEQDLERARAAAAGDQIAWRTIYDETCQPLFNFLCYQTGNRDTARDLLQETYLTALKNLDSFSGQGTLLSWLRTVALRKCLDWRRRAKIRLQRMTELAREFSPLTESTTQETFPGLGDGLQLALDRLSSRQRAALLLRELEDLPFADIADHLGCSEATARVHHHRACTNLRQWLEQGDDLVFGTGAEGMMS
jgi:RNA polymerase sigma-70 factor, ECF subfamily